MFRLIRFFTITAFILAVVTSPALASKTIDGEQASGAVYRIYLPDNWNGELVVFAHGYVPPAPPDSSPQIPEEKLYIEGKYLPELFTGMGYAFAVTSKTGLAIVQGVADVVDLVGIFIKNKKENPKNVYLVGVSQGGLVCTLALEKNPEIFSGGLSLCGPIGDFRRQINYWGDFRVVFDYFFPNMIPPPPGYLPGEVLDIPVEVMLNWESKYKSEIIAAISPDPNTGQLLSVTGAATDPNNPIISSIQTVIGLLQYNVFATNDGKATLLGQPFDNLDQNYSGSDKDNILNREVHRFEADTIALDEIQENYQTSGLLTRPLVSMHTMLDPIVPYWHEATYQKKISQNGLAGNYIGKPVNRYGHVSFTASEVLEGFDILVKRVNGD